MPAEKMKRGKIRVVSDNSEMMKNEIVKVADQYYAGGVHVTMDDNPPIVSVDGPGVEFFAQDEDAQQLMREAEETADKFGILESTALLWQLDGSGVISPSHRALNEATGNLNRRHNIETAHRIRRESGMVP